MSEVFGYRLAREPQNFGGSAIIALFMSALKSKYNLFKMSKSREKKQISCCQGLGREGGMVIVSGEQGFLLEC